MNIHKEVEIAFKGNKKYVRTGELERRLLLPKNVERAIKMGLIKRGKAYCFVTSWGQHYKLHPNEEHAWETLSFEFDVYIKT